MGKISVSNFITVDGFFAGPNGELDFMKSIEKDDEYVKFTQENASSGGTILLGHTTYEMMKSYWPTPAAEQADPKMTDVMRKSKKIVISKTLKDAGKTPTWDNIVLLSEINLDEINKLKEENDIVILGSGSIVQQLSNLDIIDEYQLLVVPVILGSGKPQFKDVKTKSLKLIESREFKNGIVSLKYKSL